MAVFTTSESIIMGIYRVTKQSNDAALSATSLADLELWAELVRRDHPFLGQLQLQPDGKYQTRSTSLDAATGEVVRCLADGFRRIPADEFPMMYCAWGRCRVGSTALANLFGSAGLPSFFQPVKAVFRNVLTGGERAPWQLPSAADEPHVFCKDVGGPYLLAECLYIPLQMLLEAGYPADRLHLIMLDRDPARSLASWFTKWSDRVARDVLVRNFVVASLNAFRIAAYAMRHGVAVSHYIHEASKAPTQAAAALFRHLGLADRYTPNAVTDWRGVEAFDTEKSRLIFSKEPAVYFVAGVHHAAPTYSYQPRGLGSVTESDLDLLDRMGVPALYRACADACASELDLPAAVAETVFGAAATADESETQQHFQIVPVA
jgi:hypothetical protein